jgi:single-strand DNA-binding protein
MSYQTLIVLGNVGKSEIRTTTNGTKVASFSVAVSEKRKGEDNTTWFNCIAFDKTAEVVERYVQKGSKVLVQGRIATRSYEKDGETKYVWEVVADRLSLESPKESGGNHAPRDDLDDGSEIPF